jgi:diguanylate cyclase (GGDEF)-like protein/PAS domain S-box-containing protein
MCAAVPRSAAPRSLGEERCWRDRWTVASDFASAKGALVGDALPWQAPSRRRLRALAHGVVRVSVDDASLQRRGQILAFISVPLFLIGVGFLLLDVVGWLLPPSEHAAYNVVTDLLFSVLIAVTWLLNRRGRVTLAAILQLTGVSAGLVFFFLFTSPYRIEVLFAVPIVVAAFVLTPWAAFIWAGISSVSFVALNHIHQAEKGVDVGHLLDVQVGLALIGLAIIACLVASCLEWTVTALRRTSEELADDIVARQEAEEARRQVETALSFSRQKNRTLFETSPVGVFLFDKRLIITECNERFVSQVCETTREQLVGSDAGRVGDRRTVPAMERALAGSAGTYEGSYRAGPGEEEKWVNFTASPLLGANQEVVGGIGVVTDLTDSKQAEELVQRLAYRDAVTGLPNRALFRDRIDQAVAVAERHGQKIVIGVLDIDRFKNVNDTLGHAQGDRLLTGVAERIGGLMRDSDSVARSGGNEFLFLLTEISTARDAAFAADRILAALREPWQFDDRKFYVSASIGLAFYPDDGREAQALLENAHTAMRRAKQRGGDALQFYDRELSALAAERLSLESELHTAIDTRQFTVHYQPQVDVRAGRIVGVEALVRWRHPRRGLIRPAEFIALAEETGLIVPLGQQVLRAACAQARDWQRLCRHPLRMAVNVSARQLREPGLIDDVAGALRETGLEPGLLEIEITETATLSTAGHADSVLHRLREMGVSVSLDDFGTGYSSLSQLRRLPITRLKIDRSFVAELPENESSAAIAGAVVDLAHAMGLGVVAEGVETRQQLDFLQARGCHEVQGFLFCRPLPAEECRAVLGGHMEPSPDPFGRLWTRAATQAIR